MINTIDIKRFRVFRDVHLPACKRINIVVGENGAGKTSFLEALFVASAQSPEAALRLRSWRGLAEGRLQGTPDEIADAMWLDLFHQFDKSKTASIVLKGDAANSRSLTVSYEHQAATLPISGNIDEDPLTAKAPILFKWKFQNREHSARPELEEGRIKIPATPRLPSETFFFAANHTYSPLETASRFSKLSRVSNESQVVKLFIENYKNVEDLSIEVIAGVPMVYAKIPHLPQKVPLNLFSSGMSKLASILFAIPTQKRGLVLIDEIENGIYHRRLPVVWESLHSFCSQFDTQIFASTHSAECLGAAAERAEQYPDDFSVIQISPGSEGSSDVHQFGGDRFSDAMKGDIEIR